MEVEVPGRVNLFGGHTDYNGGLALPCAIDISLQVKVSYSETPTVVAHRYDEEYRMGSGRRPRWAAYALNTLDVLFGEVPSVRIEIGEGIPPGAGLASSAALCIGVAYATANFCNDGIEGEELTCVVRETEYLTTGTRPGKLDPYAILHSPANGGLLCDFGSDSYRDSYLDLGNTKIAVVESGIEHSLGESAYSTRQQEVQTALDRVNTRAGVSYETPSDVPETLLRELKLGHIDRLRLEHISEENSRVISGANALKDGDVEVAGSVMNDCQESLSKKYETMTPAMDELVEEIQNVEGVHGARVTGMGWGGSVVVLSDNVDALNGVGEAVHEVNPSAGLLR